MRFRTLVCDPPWSFREGLVFASYRPTPVGAAYRYPTMCTDDIAALPVGELAEDDAHLYLWVTNSHLADGLRVMDAWGFRHKTMLTWDKGGLGMGFYFRGNTEHVLFGVRGRLRLLRSDLPNIFKAPRGRHSEKPGAFFDLVEQASPGPRVEIFGRRARFNWHAIGNEIGVGGDIRDAIAGLVAA